MAESVVAKVDSGTRKVTRRVTVKASAADIFAMVADPHRHPELDGSGTVRDTPVSGPDRLSTGVKFSVGMRQFGVPYKITSTVTAFEPDRLVEWQHPLGHRWRWELAETAPGITEVTETFDYTGSKAPKLLEIFKQPATNSIGITRTLEALAARYS